MFMRAFLYVMEKSQPCAELTICKEMVLMK